MARLGIATGLVWLMVHAGSAAAQQRVALPDRDVPLQGQPAPVWSVGAAEGESWEMLSNVRAAVFDADENLYALDTGNHRVLVFDREGSFVRVIGSQGGGPGEFQFPMSLALTPDGKLVVGEGRGFSIFTTDGTFERFIASGQGMGGLRLDEFSAHPAGGVIARTRDLPLPRSGTSPPQGTEMASPIVRFPLEEGEAPDTILPLTEPMPEIRQTPGQGARVRVMVRSGPREVFARPLRWAALPDGTVGVAEETDAWEVKLASAGRFTHTLTRGIQPRAPTERDRERAREERRATLENGGGVRVSTSGGSGTFVTSGGGGMSPEQIREAVDGLTFAERIPVIQDLFADANGRLWVERAPAVWGDPAPIDLIDAAAGRYIGTITGIELPIATSRSRLGVWVERDELEVERIVVRRIPADWS